MIYVAPHVGAWIEIYNLAIVYFAYPVAPHVGAWIEICLTSSISVKSSVAPHVGAQELFY